MYHKSLINIKKAITITKAMLHKNHDCHSLKEKQNIKLDPHTKINNAASKTLNCHQARTTMANIRTFELND